MNDKMFLLNSWPFLVDNIKTIISKIQQSALIVYDMEQSENPQRGIRLTQSLRGGGVSTRSPRPLTDLVANKLIYKILHMQFTWLLRVGGKRLRERVLEGSPLQETMASLESMAITDDKNETPNHDALDAYYPAEVGEEITEEGFVRVDLAPAGPPRVFQPKSSFQSHLPMLPDGDLEYDASGAGGPLTDALEITPNSTKRTWNPFLTSANDVENDDVQSHDDVEREALAMGVADDVSDEDLVDVKFFTHLRDVINIVGEDKFHIIAYHILVGNQVIVQGQPRHLVIELVDMLRTILPCGCVKAIPYSSVYEDSWKCNFIGLPPQVCLPEHVVDASATHFLWLGVAVSSNRFLLPTEAPVSPFIGADIEVDILKSADVPTKSPEILRRMELALYNHHLTNAMVDQCLLCLF